jgi:hypothetical protein
MTYQILDILLGENISIIQNNNNNNNTKEFSNLHPIFQSLKAIFQ